MTAVTSRHATVTSHNMVAATWPPTTMESKQSEQLGCYDITSWPMRRHMTAVTPLKRSLTWLLWHHTRIYENIRVPDIWLLWRHSKAGVTSQHACRDVSVTSHVCRSTYFQAAGPAGLAGARAPSCCPRRPRRTSRRRGRARPGRPPGSLAPPPRTGPCRSPCCPAPGGSSRSVDARENRL